MKKFFQDSLTEIVTYLELILSAILSLALFIMSLLLLKDLIFSFDKGNYESAFLQQFLSRALTLAVGVEFIKMLCKQSPSTVIEVLLVAIARQLIIGHGSTVDFLIGVIAVSGLFAIRKYLFTSFDDTNTVVLRASHKIKLANIIAKVNIPHDKNETLRHFIVKKLQENNETIAVGSCVYLKNFVLRIDNMHGNYITRVEIIKNVH